MGNVLLCTIDTLKLQASPKSGYETHWCCASLVTDAVKGVEHCHVGGQCLLCDHVAHQNHEVVVGQQGCAGLELTHLYGQEQMGGWVGGQHKPMHTGYYS